MSSNSKALWSKIKRLLQGTLCACFPKVSILVLFEMIMRCVQDKENYFILQTFQENLACKWQNLFERRVSPLSKFCPVDSGAFNFMCLYMEESVHAQNIVVIVALILRQEQLGNV